MINTIDKIKPLPLYLRNHTEPHDRGITYHLHDIMGVDCVSILKRIGLGRCIVGNVEQIPQLRLPEFTGEWREFKFKDIFCRVTRENTENNKNILIIFMQYGLVRINFSRKL